MTHVTLTNNITGQHFHFYVVVVNMTQFWARLNVLMTQLSIIEGVSPANISHTVTGLDLAA